MFEFEENFLKPAVIKVIGVGGGGGNAIATMIRSGLIGVEFSIANTDAQALNGSPCPVKVQLGSKLTKGLGAGADPEIGRRAAIEDVDKIKEALKGADMVFIAAGLGGGTGTGGAPVIAEVAEEIGALTVAAVTKPFSFEGKKRKKQAEDGLRELRKVVDTLITIPNDRLLSVTEKNTSVLEAFKMADEVLLHAIKGISDLVTVNGLINLDFADIRTIMNEMGMALMGTGTASGENRAEEAARKAIASPLLEDISIDGAKGILINITGGPDLTLHEVYKASSLVQEEADEEANIIFGAVIDEALGDRVSITVIATGFRGKEEMEGPNLRGWVSSKAWQASDVNIPAFIRKQKMKSTTGTKKTEKGIIPGLEEEESYDIPTFLRKQAD